MKHGGRRGNLLENPGMFRNISPEHDGTLWKGVERYGTLWKVMEHSRTISWKVMELDGTL